MVAAIGAISSYSDPEYLRILQELMQLGITPSYNKSTDKSKLQQAKLELTQKIQHKAEEERMQSQQVQPLEAAQNAERAKMEKSKLGAMTVAELNKIYFGL